MARPTENIENETHETSEHLETPETPVNLPPRRLTLLTETAADGIPTEPLEEDEFVRYCRNPEDARKLFAFILECIGQYSGEVARLRQELGDQNDTSKLANLREKVAALKERIKRKDDALVELAEERDRYRDAFAQDALVVRTMGATRVSPGPEASKKTSKIPDPPMLTDGKDPKFEDWLLRIQDKLAANADHYPTPAMRLAYVKSRCGGKAAEHLVARSRSNSVNKYNDSMDVLEHLKTIFLDVNRVITAKGKFRRLYMKPCDKFQEFLSEFSYLAQESGLAESEWKEELYHRIHVDMQRLVIRESNDDALDFNEFATECTRTANRLEQITQKEQRGKNQSSAAKNSNQESTIPNQKPATPAKSAIPKPDPNTKTSGRLTLGERNQLMKEGKCFYCKEQGHLSIDCPAKKRAMELKALEAGNQNHDDSDEDSEKVDP